jgi:hypothetical protein
VITYNGNQYVGIWDASSKFVACKRSTDAVAWTCVNYNGTPNAATFTGAGLNDLTSGGTATAGITATSTYEVEIDATGTPDTFKWRLNGGSYTSGVAITGSAQTLSNGVTVTFAATTGHTLANSWSVRVHPSISVSLDLHSGVGFGVDSDGIIHANLGSYVTATPAGINYRRFTSSESIDGISAAQVMDSGTGCLVNGTGAAVSCDTMTSYLTFFNDASMGLYATFRSNGVSGAADHFLWKYNTGTTSWARATGTDATASRSGAFINALADSRSIYMSTPYVDSNNKAHLVFTWRGVCGSEACARGLSYVRYDMTNGDFEKADGSAQTIPIRYSNDDSIDSTGESGTDKSLDEIEYTRPLAIDSNGYINVIYGKADSSSNAQLFRTYHNGSSWQTAQQITSTADPSRVSYSASSYSYQHRAVLLIEGTKYYVLYMSLTDGAGINVIETSDWTTFKKYALTNNNTGTYSPGYMLQAIDWPAFDATGNIYMVYQYNWYVYPTSTESYSRSPVYILKWDPSSGAGLRQQQSYGMVNYDDMTFASLGGSVRLDGTIKHEKQNVWMLKEADSISGYIGSTGIAANGDVVILAAGTYTLTSAVTITRQITLKGQGGKAQGCKTVIATSTAALSLLTITASNVSISDLCISTTGAGSETAIYVNGTGGTILTNVNIQNVDITMSGTSTQTGIKSNDGNVNINDVTMSITSSSGAALGIYTFSASTSEAAYTVDVRNATVTTSCGGGSAKSIAFGSEESSASQDSILNVRFSKGTAGETSAGCSSRGASADLGANAVLTIENSILSGTDADLFQASSGILTAKGVSLINGTTSGTITWAGTEGANNLSLGGSLTSAGTSSIGWSKQSAANQACNTTCTSACVFGQNTGDMSIVDCADATADVCTCAGAS